MAEPDKYVSFTIEDEKFMLVFDNRGRAVTEQIVGAVDSFGLGPRMEAVLLFGATRKHHRTELVNIESVYNLLDRIEDASQEEQRDQVAALFAAMYGIKKDRASKTLFGSGDAGQYQGSVQNEFAQPTGVVVQEKRCAEPSGDPNQ